jgi:hypothetical protein
MAKEYASLSQVVSKLEAEIDSQVGHMMKKHKKLGTEMKKLQKEMKNTLPPIKDNVVELQDMMIKYNAWTSKRGSYKTALMEEMPAKVRKEMGDMIADRVLRIAEDAYEPTTYLSKSMNSFDVVDKRSHEYRDAGALELLSKAMDWVKDKVDDAVKFLQTAKNQILGDSKEAKEGFEKIFKAMESGS